MAGVWGPRLAGPLVTGGCLLEQRQYPFHARDGPDNRVRRSYSLRPTGLSCRSQETFATRAAARAAVAAWIEDHNHEKAAPWP
jgi:hypothetical protein